MAHGSRPWDPSESPSQAKSDRFTKDHIWSFWSSDEQKKMLRIGKHMPTRRPTRNTLRDHFDLGRRRWATIARDPRFRALLGPRDNPQALPHILSRLYELRQDLHRSDAYRRQLQRAARARAPHTSALAQGSGLRLRLRVEYMSCTWYLRYNTRRWSRRSSMQ